MIWNFILSWFKLKEILVSLIEIGMGLFWLYYIYGMKMYDCCVFFKKLKCFKLVVVSCLGDIFIKRW